ncbi:MAG: DNA phosphorothioation system sulfurtransferase DndC [Candidatus Aminicenantes bacterium]|jgi:DNA sulfur modification protein DndC
MTLGNIFKETKNHIKKVYMTYNRPLVVGFSGGKDSTLTLQLVWETIEEMSPEQLKKDIHVITVDTLVETPFIVSYINTNISAINKAAKEKCLPIQAHKLSPQIEDTFWVNLIGRGYPAPSQKFRWCTDRLKIEPVNQFTRQSVSRFGEVTIVLGARSAESSSRGQVLEKKKRDVMGLSRHPTLTGAYVFTPIEKLTTEEVWQYLSINHITPWGTNNLQLRGMYKNAAGGECPLVVDKSTPTCGSSRFGCWTCTLVSKDTAMESLIDSGENWMYPLLEFRNLLSSTQDPDRKSKYRRHKRRDGKVRFKRNGDELSFGPYKMEWRKEFLKLLLETQKLVKGAASGPYYTLISLAELKLIRKIWKNEEYDWEDSVPKIYREVMGEPLPIEDEDGVNFTIVDLKLLERICENEELPLGLVAKLIDEERKMNGVSKRSGIIPKIDRVLSEEWRSTEEFVRESIKIR